MVHQRAARVLLVPLFLAAFGFFPAVAHADDGECHEGRQASGCVAACDDDIVRDDERDAEHDDDGDERDEVRRHSRSTTSSGNRGKGGDERDDVEIDDDCLPPAVVPEVSLAVLLPASAASILAAVAYIGRRRRPRTA